jgi:hypothetical protein
MVIMQRERPRQNDPPRPRGGLGLTVFISPDARDLLAIRARKARMSLQGYLRHIVAMHLAASKRRTTLDYLRSLAGPRKSINV